MPRCYLKKFTIEGEKSLIWSLDKAKANYLRTPSSVKKICAEDYYYYQVDENGEVDHTALEDALSDVEGIGIQHIDKLINASSMPYSPLGEKEQGELAFFLALLLTRGPAFRNAVNDLHGLMVQQMLAKPHHNREIPEPPSMFDDLIKEKGIKNLVDIEIFSFVSLPL